MHHLPEQMARLAASLKDNETHKSKVHYARDHDTGKLVLVRIVAASFAPNQFQQHPFLYLKK